MIVCVEDLLFSINPFGWLRMRHSIRARQWEPSLIDEWMEDVRLGTVWEGKREKRDKAR